MKVVGLISGGKDSCYNLMQCVAAGHEIVALANLAPDARDELDSYMYQSVGHMGVGLYAEAMGIPLYRRTIHGSSLNISSLHYSPTSGDEVEDMYHLLQQVKEACGIEAVAVGAVLSEYQRSRVENVCQRLGLVPLAYLWRREQSELLQEMVDCGVDAIVIKVASFGLSPSRHLGKSIKELQPHFEEMKKKYSLNVCGEGGEYETFTLDCPLFKKKIIVEETELVQTSEDVGYLNLTSLRLEDKESEIPPCSKVKKPLDFLQDLQLNEAEQQAENQAKESSQRKASMDIESERSQMIEECNVSILASDPLDALIKSPSGFCWSSVQGSSVNEAVAKLKSTLQERNLSLEDLVSVRLFVRDLLDKSHNIEYAKYFTKYPPTRAFIQLPPEMESAVCLDAIAWEKVHPTEENGEPDSPSHSPCRTTMHVQSISHWAPANIGPYSQAIKVGNVILIAGMIGLVPGTMELLTGSVELQTRLSLRHIDRVISAIAPKSDIRAIVQGVCYVTSISDIPVARRMMARVSESQISTYVVVPSLPRDAQVEWHAWGHTSNEKFDYEEKGYTRHSVNVRLRRRFSTDHSTCAVITTVGCQKLTDVSEDTLEELVTYCLQNALAQSPRESLESMRPLNLTLFYKSHALPLHFLRAPFLKFRAKVHLSLIPVTFVEDHSTVLSLVAIRH